MVKRENILIQNNQDNQITVGGNRGENGARTSQDLLGAEQEVGVRSSAEWVHIEYQLKNAVLTKARTLLDHKYSRSHLAHEETGGRGSGAGGCGGGSLAFFLRGRC